MDFDVKHYPGGDRKLLFIFGFGCTDKQPGLRWFLERLKKRNYDITCVQLPTDISDFEDEVLVRLRDIEKVLDDHVGVGFSYGGLALSFLDRPRRRIFIAPFWAVNERWKIKGGETIATVLSVIPTPLLKRKFDTNDAGDLAVDEDLLGMPERISFRSIHQFFEAQKLLPDPRTDDFVFYSRKDNVVSPGTIEKRIRSFDLGHQIYDGGHLFYLDEGREGVIIRMIQEIDGSFPDPENAS